ncbi:MULTISPECIES: FKBP-type peptidyl-prolyl cis-trans isomerase [Shewanella]|uniref:Peptidyl-prolyl cis-trans isomerase n=1 Tax=Shewanella glacialipiscicola TaxID=614069 RepID=A0ABQ6J6B9_9GAMM|nr:MULTISPECIES: FKBP-type peptidyl-prolyl cis-trans isomerase [Shewanella]MCL1087603.1 FKBP-type peptidyl-prolyl cis-trans isomerase [Shewanella glacialipiscicola]MCU7996315.1 FKBP-type peptidyl-prolyl cis-trans isomerase [Shewanella glacialipiscicola]MCU8027628.1 FKBP-type peptidyl-prolyl cis-trans isomerase [Shewanella glacialipiscicola]SIQ60842.1 FKBP-type peptidyl-prolyl cis-trans isomerase SlpA [Shewanella morhuae]GIU11827.1 peptidyl-prolyl cis-trans isomerase [Shewanella morhuae]
MTVTRSLLCHMNIVLSDGSTADSTKASGKPARLNVGDGTLSPAFEAQLVTLAEGDKHSFTLEAIDAFGESNPDAIHYLDRSRFPADMSLEAGVIVSFAGPGGSEIPGIVRDVAGDSITVDLNHPLAGHKITFELDVVKVL